MPRHTISKTRNNPDANSAKHNIKYKLLSVVNKIRFNSTIIDVLNVAGKDKDNISKIIKVNNDKNNRDNKNDN